MGANCSLVTDKGLVQKQVSGRGLVLVVGKWVLDKHPQAHD